MKRNKILAGVVAAALSLGSCQSWLDVNTDPNNLSEVNDPAVMVPVTQMSIANTLMGWDMGLTGAVWSQYYTQSHTASQFRAIDQYNEVSFAGTYQELTAGTLNDLKGIAELAMEQGDNGTYLMAEALSIFTWQVLTDTWGAVPYFEALKGNEGVYSPSFNSGEEIYTDLLTRIDAALALDLSNASIKAPSDFYYGGNVQSWVAFTKALKLKLMMRLSETSQYDATAVKNYVDANITDLAAFVPAMVDGAVYFTDMDGKRHPHAEFEAGGASYYSTNVIASKTFLEYLRAGNDPRLDAIYIAPEDGHQGAFQGDFHSEEDTDGDGTSDEKEKYSTVSFNYNDNLYVLSAWEVNFLIAEAYARAGEAASAKMYYDAGVTASLEHHAIEATDIINGGYAEFVAGTAEQMVEQIAMQRWVAFAKTQHWEAFLERNRTKYPAVSEIDIEDDRKGAFENFPVGMFTISVNGRAKLNGNLPASPTYPQSVLTRNNSETVPGQKANVGEKIWWDQKAGK